MIRGIERKEIFRPDKDRNSLLNRLGGTFGGKFHALLRLVIAEQPCSFSTANRKDTHKELGISPSAVSKSIERGGQALGNEALEECLMESQ